MTVQPSSDRHRWNDIREWCVIQGHGANGSCVANDGRFNIGHDPEAELEELTRH